MLAQYCTCNPLLCNHLHSDICPVDRFHWLLGRCPHHRSHRSIHHDHRTEWPAGVNNRNQAIASSLSVGSGSRASSRHLHIYMGNCTSCRLLGTHLQPDKSLIYRSGLHFLGRSCHHHSHRSIRLGRRTEWPAGENNRKQPIACSLPAFLNHASPRRLHIRTVLQRNIHNL